ncbi:hypothetical protein BD626DRAFT_213035 [Schizophyllum amplum]|uniref:Ubiquitin-activating enzyme E1-like n=1 Tax=Schizophyllum amplum TaxID=97359 RepID=A0A550BXX6_9AGAR|nr:hypothetical protein BD626DRAFT_213035 [Auriculariopsis ampla]
MSTAARRTAHAKAVLGEELHSKLADTKVLLVGAGGIGCELLKNVVLAGFGHITLLDLDTIDLSNLNRQFLFRKKDVKQSKSLVAAAVAAPFNPNVRITPIHGNIKDPEFDLEWFHGFDIVLNALDNLDARRHVNKMCMAANIPLVESGTAGYLGQVQPIFKDKTECFDCVPKPTPKTFPVCTIRSTPSQPIHCIVWSKTYLMGQLFGEDEDATGELDEAEKQGENAQEIATLRKEAQAFAAVRKALRDPASKVSAAKMAFDKVFNADIKNLLIMSDMWRNRSPPTPLDFDGIMSGVFVIPESQETAATGSTAAKPAGSAAVEQQLQNGVVGSSSAAKLKDQRTLTLKDNLELFADSANRLAARLQTGEEETISFDKDDDDTLDFVTAASNLRSFAYGIARKTRWEVKEMAGNIIPAIATTNAVISGLIVLQALQLLRKSYDQMRTTMLQHKPAVPLQSVRTCRPDERCGVCRDVYVDLRVDGKRARLGDVVGAVARAVVENMDKGEIGSVANGDAMDEDEDDFTSGLSVFEDKRILMDPDFDDNKDRTLESLGVTRGKFLTLVDEDGVWGRTVQCSLGVLPMSHPADQPPYILPSTFPKVPRKPREPTPVKEQTPPRASLKRSAPEDDDIEGPAAKRAKAASAMPDASPSKKRRLEEDGLILLENATETLDDEDIIILDD